MLRLITEQASHKTSFELGHDSGTRPFLAIDMFAGCGGVGIGLKNAGFDVVYANEINKDAAATYRHNLPDVMLDVKDVALVDPREVYERLGRPELDVLAAGPPCQGFSTAGRREPRDRRNHLYKIVLTFASVFHPKIIVIENVRGMLSALNGGFVERIKKELSQIGYYPHHKVLTSSRFGIPQTRKRVFIIATSREVPANDLFPKKTRPTVTVSQAISDLAFLGVGEEARSYRDSPRSHYQESMRATAGELYNHLSPKHSVRMQNLFASIPQGVEARSVLGQGYSGKRSRTRLHPQRPSKTLTTLPEDYIHYSQNRIPTVREMARLQSFPDDFVFLGPRTTGGRSRKRACPQYTQVGNAIPPMLAHAVFANLSSVLEKYY